MCVKKITDRERNEIEEGFSLYISDIVKYYTGSFVEPNPNSLGIKYDDDPSTSCAPAQVSHFFLSRKKPEDFELGILVLVFPEFMEMIRTPDEPQVEYDETFGPSRENKIIP